MDIFTTQLTRVVPVPIKSTSLKVKALVKDAETGKLTEDPDHLENHDFYFSVLEKDTGHSGEPKHSSEEVEKDENKEEDNGHLDIFV